ncbi:MAG: LacI family DNA-binding transcriptional regulator [Lentisphaeria bacterium]
MGLYQRAEEIRALAKKLGFRPNAAARAMQRGQFNRIALVTIRNVGRNPMGWSILQSYLDYAVSALADRGYALVIEPFDQERDAQCTLHEPPRLFSEILVDGALALDSFGHVRPEVDTHLKAMRMPVVWLNRNPTPGVCGVYCDEPSGARQLVNHLLELGHTRIGYWGGGGRHYSSVERMAAVRMCLANAGLSDEFVAGEVPHPASLLAGLAALLRQPERPTAIIAYNHIVYDAVMEAAANLGLRVPGDLSVAYFASQWELNADVDPTAVRLPEGEMAKLGVELLLKRVARSSAAAVGTQRMLPGTLVIGSTTGPAPAG